MGYFRRFRPACAPLLDWDVGISRRKFLRNSMAAIAGAALPLAAYSQFIEPHHLTVEHLNLSIPGLPEPFDGFRIAQLSDLHFFPYTRKAEIDAAVTKANSLAPDLSVLTGDFITSNESKRRYTPQDEVYAHMGVCAELVSRLKAPYGVYACAGNHDAEIGSRYVQGALRDFGIPLLINESRPIERDGHRIWIAGLGDAIHDKADISATLTGVPQGEITVLLAHEPDLADMVCRHPVALQLSGHSHGGQIRLPLIGCPYLPSLARKYPYGYYKVGTMHLYTNRGIGEILLPYRFNAPPEITVITLRR